MTDKERSEFLKTHLELLLFVGVKKNIIPPKTSFREYLDFEIADKFECRKAMYEDEDIIDEYLASNYDHLDHSQIAIINSFKKRIDGDFMVLRCLKKNAVFININTENVYLVEGISDSFDYFFDYYPILITTAIIPFKERIIYDGFFASKNIRYGSGIKKRLNDIYRLAKEKKKIISKLI